MDLKPGQILLFKPKKFDLIGKRITALEGDSDKCHAAIVGKNGKILTTGARFTIKGFVYGEVDPEKYLKGRVFDVVETVEPLTPGQLEIIFSACESLFGQTYGWWKLARLVLRKNVKGGVITKIHNPPHMRVKNPFCSEAVAFAFWKAGIKICGTPRPEGIGKEEPSAITPENIDEEAKMGKLIRFVSHGTDTSTPN
jgi:hypothetical protein